MDALLNVETVTSPHNLKGLRQLYDKVESHIRSLNTLGVTADSYGSLLASALLKKIPQDLCLIMIRKAPGSEWKLDSLLKMMEEELVARERTALSSSQQPPTRRVADKPPHTATTLMSGNPPVTPQCCYCRQAHCSTTCQTVTQVEARKQLLMKAGRCFICLRRGHIGRECRSHTRCSKCNGKHNVSICERDPKEPTRPPTGSTPQQGSVATSQSTPSSLNPAAPPYTSTSTTSCVCADPRKAVLLQTARAHLSNPQNPHHSIEARILMDSGSQRSYISERVRAQLSLLPEGEQYLLIATFGKRHEEPRSCPIVRVGMKLKDGATLKMSLLVVPMICEPLVKQPIADCAEAYQHLASLELADFSSGDSTMEVDVLIGCDYYWELATGDTCRGSNGPIAIHTKLGWVLSGPTKCTSLDQSSVNLVTTHVLRADAQEVDNRSLDETLKSFWELESLGIQGSEKTLYEEFSQSVELRDGRYEVSLPWKDNHNPLPDNFQLSLTRVRGLIRRLQQMPSILQEYDHIIREQLKRGIVEAVTNSSATGGQVHYLPHHAVVRSDKTTTKLRIVYDASARTNGPSLNDCLYTGPKFDQKILDILLRFRVHRVALTGDIEKAFLMISMAEKDRDVLRFLWVNNIRQDPPEICTFRFARVVFGVSSSPFLLNATIRHHLEQFLSSHADVVQNLLRSTYVDDIVTGAESDDQAFNLYTDAKEILRTGGFNLRKFATSSPQLQQRITRAEEALELDEEKAATKSFSPTYAEATLGNVQVTQPGEHKILGVRWDAAADRLIFDLADIAKLASSVEPTKRNVTSTIGKFYDPLGFLAPVVRYFSRRSVKLRLTGTSLFLRHWSDDGIPWLLPLVKASPCLSHELTSVAVAKKQRCSIFMGFVTHQPKRMEP